MKFVIETGSGSHTTSSASVQAKFVGGEYNGQHLYQQKKFQVQSEWDDSKLHEKWVSAVYELPEGTQIAVVGKGRTGNRGSTRWEYHCIYRLDPVADVIEQKVEVGLRVCTFKGRLILVKDVLKEQEVTAQINREEGF